jgi:CHAT domain-containing protein
MDSALALARSAKDQKEEARALLGAGKLCYFTNECDRGLLLCDSALILARQIGDLRIESGVLDLQGSFYCQLSQYDKAIACLDSCLVIDRNTVERGHTRTYLSLQWAHRAMTHWDKALALCDSALAVARSMQDPKEVSLCLYYRAVTFLDFDQFEAGISYLDSAYAIAREINDTVTMMWTLGSLGESYLHLKEYERALEYLIGAHNGAKELNETFLETGMKICIGLSYCGLDEYGVALAYLDSALTIARQMNVVHYIAWCYQGIGLVHFKRGQYDEALAYYDSALMTFQGFEYRSGEAMMLDYLGQVCEKIDDWEKAIDYYKASIEIREMIRKEFKKEEVERCYVEAQKDIYERLAILLIMLERYEEAFDYIERSRSEKLRKAFEKGTMVAYDPSLQRILERINILTNEIYGLRRRFQNREIEEIAFEEQKNELEGRLNQVMLDFKAYHPQFYNVVVPQQRLLEEIQGIIPDSILFISFAQISDSYVVMLFAKEMFMVQTREEPHDSIDQLVMHALTSIKWHAAKEEVDAQVSYLYQILLQPSDSAIMKYPNLVIIPSGILHYLPFHALLCRNEQGRPQYFLQQKRISYLPSASFLVDLFKEKKEAPQELLAFGNADGTLPSAEIEVDLIARFFDRCNVYKCDSARKDCFIKTSNDYALVHLATHGILATDPRFSYIVLAPPVVGNLTVREIFGLSGHFNQTSLVTLSACETAVEAEPETAGMELVTLSNAFKVAGVPTTIASLWEIADRSTSLLMENFYANLKDNKMNKLEALRQAQLAMLDHDQFSHPYYWAPFVLFGDWR